jgi:hypothetical protein
MFSVCRDVKRKVMQFGCKGFVRHLPQIIYGKLEYEWKHRSRAREERQFDRAHAVETRKRIRTAALDVPDRLLPHVVGYEPSPVQTLKTILASLPVVPTDFVFMDIGAGKGRAMMVAAECGFKELIGLEISRQLSEAARQNLTKFAGTSRGLLRWSVVTVDATEYAFPDEHLLVYMYNPFDGGMLQRVLANLQCAVERFKRKVVVVYYWPRFKDTFAQFPSFELLHEHGRWAAYLATAKADRSEH